MLSLNRLVSVTTAKWNGATNQMLSVEQVPPDAREIAILRGYRPVTCTPLQCAASVFNATNETLNFWTHFIPVWYFWWKLWELSHEKFNFIDDPYTWPFLAYMLTCCVYPLTSCGAHVFSSISNTARHICYFIDYAALSMYSYGAAILYRGYSLPDSLLDSGLANMYIVIAVLNSTASTLMACTSRFTISPVTTKLLRLGAFVIPYVWESVPLLYRVLFCEPITEEASIVGTVVAESVPASPHHTSSSSCCASAEALMHHSRQFLVSVVGAFAYASHVPERLAPGTFDFIGHSHQLLHVCSILATNEQMTGSLLDLEHRRSLIERQSTWVSSNYWTWGSLIGLLLINMAVVGWFIQYVLKNVENKEYSYVKSVAEVKATAKLNGDVSMCSVNDEVSKTNDEIPLTKQEIGETKKAV